VTTRIGVLADTHCPEFVERLPEAVLKAFERVDLILHAGDVNAQETLEALRRLAPVDAVRGDHDRAMPQLPASREVVVEGRRIVVVHGNRSHWVEEPHTLLWTLSLGYFQAHRGLPRALKRRFPDADVIVYGHTHRASIETIDGTLIFNPGAVHQWSPRTAARRLKQKVGWFEWCWLQVARHLRRFERPSVGTLELGESGIRAEIIPL
jgi:putative phosphoesterase